MSDALFVAENETRNLTLVRRVRQADSFFTRFHELLFPPGSWTFAFSETLIRLFPEKFWFDVGVLVGAGTFLQAGLIGLIAHWLDVPTWIPLAVGIALIPWVWFLLQTVRREPLRRGDLVFIVAGNVGWAVAAAIVILGFPDALSTAGRWIVGIFSLAVLDFGLTEWMGLRSLHDPTAVRV